MGQFKLKIWVSLIKYMWNLEKRNAIMKKITDKSIYKSRIVDKLVERDLSIYAQSLSAKLFHY